MSEYEVYKLLKEIRISKKLSQSELAKKVGLSQQAIALIESGKRKLDVNMFISMLNKMELTSKEMNAVTSAITSNCTIKQATEELQNDSEIELKYQKATIDAYFNRLNDIGKKEAVKRIRELAEIKEYTQNKT